MFDEEQYVTIKWYSGNKEYYTNLGYEFTKFKDTFQVPFKIAKSKSKLEVKVNCEYCGREYATNYATYLVSISRGKAACEECKGEKIRDTLRKKYGADSLGGSKELRERAKKAMKNKYGKEYTMQTKQGQENFEKTMLERYGYKNPVYCPELQAKAKNSMYLNRNTPTSLPERKIIDMLIEMYGEENCIAGFPYDKVNFDCLLTLGDNKIDVEYDGWYWHKDTQDYDRRRNHWLVSEGFKVLRIKGNKKDDLPTIERLKEEVEYLLNGNSIGYIDMND